jgi:hypothetical protein
MAVEARESDRQRPAIGSLRSEKTWFLSKLASALPERLPCKLQARCHERAQHDIGCDGHESARDQDRAIATVFGQSRFSVVGDPCRILGLVLLIAQLVAFVRFLRFQVLRSALCRMSMKDFTAQAPSDIRSVNHGRNLTSLSLGVFLGSNLSLLLCTKR